jgi:hypothetical protein
VDRAVASAPDRVSLGAVQSRILFVPIFGAFEATVFTEQAASWAEVASFDGPGAGSRRDQAVGEIEDVAAAGSERLDELGWERCVLACDSHAQAAGVELALADRRVAGVAISHAAARYTSGGERPALSPGVLGAAAQLLESDLRSFGRALTQLTQGTIDEYWVDRFLEAVPRETARARTSQLAGRELTSRLVDWDGEVVLGLHDGCLMWTREGFEDAASAVPEARTVECDGVPLADPRFADAIRELCARVFG